MKKNITLFLTSFVLFFLADFSLFSQYEPTEYSTFYTYNMAKNGKDTIVAIRKLNQWWFGILAGPNVGFSFGDLYSKWNPSVSNPEMPNQIVEFNNSFGWGYYAGLLGEYIPSGSKLGYGLRIIPLDRDITDVTSDEMRDGFDTKFDFKSKLTYLAFTPYIRYNVLGMSGLHLLFGLDAKINISSTLEQIAKFDNSGHIIHKYEVKDINAKSRFGVSFGVAYDLFFADFFGAANRVRLTPFVDLKLGSDVITDLGSNWNNIGIKFGAQLKLSPDKVTYDTLFYDPESNEVPVYYASTRSDIGVEYPGRRASAHPPEVVLAAVIEPTETKPAVSVVIPEKDSSLYVGVNVPTDRLKVKPKLKINIDEKIVQTFATSATTQLTTQQRSELDEIAVFLKENPNTIVRIEGHSDNRGTVRQNEDRARARGQNAMNYLLSKGIPQSRIFMQGRGALVPIATNDTEAGRRRNRRIEILVQPSR